MGWTKRCSLSGAYDSTALYKAIRTFDGRYSIEQLKEKVDIENFLQSLHIPVVELYYYLSVEHELTEKCRICRVEEIIDGKVIKENKQVIIDTKEIEKRKHDITLKLLEIGHSSDLIAEKISDRENNNPLNLSTFIRNVSGKDIILPSIQIHSQYQLSNGALMRIKPNAWKLNLAENCDLSPLNALKNDIIDALSPHE